VNREATKRFLRYHLPVILWGVLVALALLVPVGRVQRIGWPGWLAPLRPWADKVAHGLLFFVMALLCYRSIRTVPRIRMPLALTAIAVVLYGALLEVLQSFSVVRRTELGDLGANALGVLLFGAVVLLAERLRD
jgi:hypothetical protein